MALPPLNPAGYVLGVGAKTRCQRGNVGWDVVAIQRGLLSLVYKLPRFGADGWYGDETMTAVRSFQKAQGLGVDGWAGPATQQRLVTLFINMLSGLPANLAKTQIGRESGLLPGNHSEARKPRAGATPRYEPDVNGNYFDNGAGQMASELYTYEEAYDPRGAIDHYAASVKGKYAEYKRLGVIKDERRLWELAAGSWNAPAWTDRLARGLSLSDANQATIEGYIDRVTADMMVPA